MALTGESGADAARASVDVPLGSTADAGIPLRLRGENGDPSRGIEWTLECSLLKPSCAAWAGTASLDALSSPSGMGASGTLCNGAGTPGG